MRASLDATEPTGSYALNGPASLCGEATAANWSAALGRDVCYEPDLATSNELLETYFGGHKSLDFPKTYHATTRFAVETTPAQRQQTEFLLGRPPRGHAEYFPDSATEWVVQAAA